MESWESSHIWGQLSEFKLILQGGQTYAESFENVTVLFTGG